MVEENLKDGPTEMAKLLQPLNWRLLIVITFVSALLALALRWQALGQLSTAFIGGAEQDAGLYIWLIENNIAWFEGKLPGRLFDTNSFYPYGRGLAWSDNYVLPSLMAWPLVQLDLPLPLVWNVISLGVLFLNGWCTSYVALRLTGKPLPSILAGALFLSYQSLNGHVGHPQLQWAFFIPLGALAFLRSMSTRTFGAGLTLGLIVTAAFLTTVYYSLFIVLLCIGLWLPLLVQSPHSAIRHTKALIPGLLFGLTPLIPFLPPYLEVKQTFGARGLYESYSFSASLLSYLSASPFNRLYNATSTWSHSEAQLFPGLTALLMFTVALVSTLKGCSGWSLVAVLSIAVALTSSLANELHLLCGIASWTSLALFLVVLRKRRDSRNLMGIFSFATLISVFASFGPLGLPGGENPPSGVYAMLHLMPGFDALRAVGRVGFLATWCLTQVTALLLSTFRQTFFSHIAVAALTGLIIFENYNSILPFQTETPPLPIIATLRDQPGGAVVMLPFTETLTPEGKVKSWSNFSRLNVHYMRWGLLAGKPVMNGYSGQRSKIMMEYPRLLSSFPAAESVSPLLRIAGLRYILHCARCAKGAPSHQPDPRFTLIERDGEGNELYRLNDERKLQQREEVLVPPNFGNTMELELFATTPFAQVHVEFGNGEYQLLTIPKAEEWTSFIVQLPKDHEKVRPLRVILTSKETISLRNVTPARVR